MTEEEKYADKFGPPPPTIDWDLESYYDWSAVRRLNLIKTRNEKGPRRAEDRHRRIARCCGKGKSRSRHNRDYE